MRLRFENSDACDMHASIPYIRTESVNNNALTLVVHSAQNWHIRISKTTFIAQPIRMFDIKFNESKSGTVDLRLFSRRKQYFDSLWSRKIVKLCFSISIDVISEFCGSILFNIIVDGSCFFCGQTSNILVIEFDSAFRTWMQTNKTCRFKWAKYIIFRHFFDLQRIMESDEEPRPTSQSAKSIKAISKDTVHRICSGQVILLPLGTHYIQITKRFIAK